MTILIVLLAGYVALCAVVFFSQRSLIFFPMAADRQSENALANRSGFDPWLNADGEFVGWVSRTGDPANAWVIFHGNAGSALDRMYYAGLTFPNDTPAWKVYLFEYPGYASRPGVPSEKSLTESAITAVTELSSNPEIQSIWLTGESLGTGVASAVAAALPDSIAGVVQITPFDSLVSAAKLHHPFLPVSLLLQNRFPSDTNLAKFHGPVAIVLAGRDRVVPAKLGRRLYDRCNDPKRLWMNDNAGHNDAFVLLENWPEIVSWMQANRTSQSAPNP